MKKKFSNQSFLILLFLGIFGFSIGLFDNYRELWMQSVGISSVSISHVISISYFVTVLILLFFTIKVSPKKLKIGILMALIFRLITGAILIWLKSSSNFFGIKFVMFFDIAFTQLIVASIYPFLMNIKKNDVIYTKKSVVESLSNRFGFLLVSVLLGKVIFGRVFDYNSCLFLSFLFAFLSFFVLLFVKTNTASSSQNFDVMESISYFKQNKIFLFYLVVTLLGNIAFNSFLGMRMLTLTQKLNFSATFSSFFVLGFGILASIFSIVVVKYLKSKNDSVNLFFKFGIRLPIYFFVFLTGSKWIFLFGIMYLLLTEHAYDFLFSGFFINHIDERYSLFLTTLKYCVSLIGSSVGVFFCGLFFDNDIKYFVIPVLFFGIIHYVFASILVKKKQHFLKMRK